MMCRRLMGMSGCLRRSGLLVMHRAIGRYRATVRVRPIDAHAESHSGRHDDLKRHRDDCGRADESTPRNHRSLSYRGSQQDRGALLRLLSLLDVLTNDERAYVARLGELLIVGGWTVDRRHRALVQAQVDRQLSTMVREVIERIAQHDMARLIEHDVAAGE